MMVSRQRRFAKVTAFSNEVRASSHRVDRFGRAVGRRERRRQLVADGVEQVAHAEHDVSELDLVITRNHGLLHRERSARAKYGVPLRLRLSVMTIRPSGWTRKAA